jgi:hypothetical protein
MQQNLSENPNLSPVCLSSKKMLAQFLIKPSFFTWTAIAKEYPDTKPKSLSSFYQARKC